MIGSGFIGNGRLGDDKHGGLQALLLLVFGVAAVWSYTGDRPTIETCTTVYVVPWPWDLEWQDGGFVMRLEIRK